MDLVNDLFRVTVSPDGPDDATVISTINGTGFVATHFSGAFHVDSGATIAPQAEAAPEPIRGALLRARDADKLVLVDFSAAWCAPCKRMLEEVYSESRVAAVLKERYVFLKVDTDEFPDAGKPYGVAGIPDARLLAADGRQLGRVFGYQSPDAVLELLAAAEKAAGLAPLEQLPTPEITSTSERSPETETPSEQPTERAAARTRSVLRVEGMT